MKKIGIIGAMDVEAVSYTHLDVYKRQVEFSHVSFSYPGADEDVYKRQV